MVHKDVEPSVGPTEKEEGEHINDPNYDKDLKIVLPVNHNKREVLKLKRSLTLE